VLIPGEAQLNPEYHAENRPHSSKRLFDTAGRRFAGDSSAARGGYKFVGGGSHRIAIKANKNGKQGDTG
jgi:hypothetical protein